MKEYIVLTIDSYNIFFDYKAISEDEIKHVNKLEFYNDKIIVTLKFYKKYYEKVISLFKDKRINTLTIKRLITFKYSIYILDELNIERLRLDFASTISLSDYEMFLDAKSLRYVDCYYMPVFIRDKFKVRGVKVNLYNKYKVTDKFMLNQDAFDYETLYYKKNIDIKEEYPELLRDMREFLRINYNLKAIHLYVFSKDLLKGIIDLLRNDETREIIIFLHQGSDEDNFITKNFRWLKEVNKKCKDTYVCELRIVYSNQFLFNNLFKQLTFNNLKLISLMCIYVSMVSLIIVKSYEYVEKMSIDELNNTINNGSYAYDNNFDLDRLNDKTKDEDDGVIDDEDDSNSINNGGTSNNTGGNTTASKPNKYQFEKVFSKLKKINNETVGFLTVKGTKINYPVVKHSDNSFYLKYDFYKKKSVMGWVYMDYRNDAVNLSTNNIIYGHNMANGTMFGTLKNVLSSNYKKNNEDMIINYDVDGKSYKFKIFAGYRVEYTTDYLKTEFENKKEFDEFVKLIRGRSTFKTDVKVEYGDKLITLSTCTSNGKKRLVVHGVLIKE